MIKSEIRTPSYAYLFTPSMKEWDIRSHARLMEFTTNNEKSIAFSFLEKDNSLLQRNIKM